MLRSLQTSLQCGKSFFPVFVLSSRISQKKSGACYDSFSLVKKTDLIASVSWSVYASTSVNQQQNQVYILPTTLSNSLYKKTIINPLKPTEYKLPTLISIIEEKMTPGLDSCFPKIDPDPLHVIVDRGSPPVEKYCMPYLMRIRKRKMKKHKLKKTRKRLLALNKSMSLVKKAKKEAKIRAYEKKFFDAGKTFDPQEFVNEQIRLAKKGGWGIDVLQSWKQSSVK